MALSELSKAIRTQKMETEKIGTLERRLANLKPGEELGQTIYYGNDKFEFVSNGKPARPYYENKLANARKRLAAAEAIINAQ